MRYENLELKVPPVVVFMVIAVLMVIASSYLPRIPVPPGLKLGLTFVLTLLAVITGLLGVWEFRRLKTTVDPRSPEKASSLVDTGIYQITRNPMYLALVVLLVAIVVAKASPWLMTGVVAFVLYMTRFQIKPEERLLSGLFGEEYVGYCKKVRRWL